MKTICEHGPVPDDGAVCGYCVDSAPVPPAGDMEVHHQYLCKGLYERWMPLQESEVEDAKREGFQIRELVDHFTIVTRLTAENNLLRHDVASFLETMAKTCDLLGIDLDAAKSAEGKPSDVLFEHAKRLTAERDGLENELDAAADWDAAQLKVIHGLNGDIARLQSELTKALELLAATAGFSGPTMDELEQARLYLSQSAPAAKGASDE